MEWSNKNLKEAFDYIKKGPKASRLGDALGEIGDGDSKNLERLCPHCYDVLEVNKDYPIWGCLNCTKSFVATENIDNQTRVAIASLAILGVVFKIALRDEMVANIETKKVAEKLVDYCGEDIPKEYQTKIQKLVNKDKYSLDYFSEIMFASFEGKNYRNYRDILYRIVFELISADGKLFSYEMNILKELESLMKFDYPIYNYLYKELINSLTQDDVKKLLKAENGEELKSLLSQKEELYKDETMDKLYFPTMFKNSAKKHFESFNKPLSK